MYMDMHKIFDMIVRNGTDILQNEQSILCVCVCVFLEKHVNLLKRTELIIYVEVGTEEKKEKESYHCCSCEESSATISSFSKSVMKQEELPSSTAHARANVNGRRTASFIGAENFVHF